MIKTTEELTIENENLKQGNIKVWEQLEKSTEILSHHEAYISLLEEENTKLKELLKEAYPVIDYGDGAMMSKWEANWLTKAKEILGEDK